MVGLPTFSFSTLNTVIYGPLKEGKNTKVTLENDA